jgi:hypothetical protein
VLRNDVDLNAAPPSSDDGDWTWPPYAPVESVEVPQFGTEEWAPASSVRHPWVKVGRWTLLYRRAA